MSVKTFYDATLEAVKSGASGAASRASVPAAVVEGAKTACTTAAQGGEWALANPATAVGAALIVGGATVIAAPAAVSAPVLGAAGFVPGVAKASAAAGLQSGMGNVAAGSLFATLQSAGAGGAGAAAVSGAVQAGGAGVAAAGAGMMAWARSKV